MPSKPPNIFKRVKRKLKKDRIKDQITIMKIIGGTLCRKESL